MDVNGNGGENTTYEKSYDASSSMRKKHTKSTDSGDQDEVRKEHTTNPTARQDIRQKNAAM